MTAICLNEPSVRAGLVELVRMGTRLYVGNLSYHVSDSELEQVFGEFGTVQSAKIIMDRETGRSKGFAFVEMGSDDEAQAAMDNLNGKDLQGRDLKVNEARPMAPRSGGGGGGGFRGGRGGGGGRDRGGW